MTVLLGAIGWGLIAIGALTHTWHHDRLRELLGAHVDADRPAAAALLAAEIVIVVAVGLAFVTDTGWLGIAAVAGALLGLGFVVWIARLLASGSDLPCACSFSSAPTSGWSLARALAVVPVGLLAFADLGTLTVAERSTGLVVGIAVAAAIYVLPEALGWPEFARAQLARLDSHAPTQRAAGGDTR